MAILMSGIRPAESLCMPHSHRRRCPVHAHRHAPSCRAPSVFKENPPSTSHFVGREPSRRLAAAVVGIGLFAVVAGTRAVLVSPNASADGLSSPAVATGASLSAAGQTLSGATVALARTRSAHASSATPFASTQSTSTSQIPDASDAASATQSADALSGAQLSPEAAVLSVPIPPSVGAPVGRGQPAHVAFDWLVGRSSTRTRHDFPYHRELLIS